MIDIAKERTFSFGEAKRFFPSRPNTKTVYNWAMYGKTIRAKCGKEIAVVKLEWIETPTGRQTSEQAYIRFVTSMTRARKRAIAHDKKCNCKSKRRCRETATH